MKHLLTSVAFAATAVVAQGVVYNFTPSDSDIGDLDHHYAYTWGMNLNLGENEVITGATLTINNIWDWRREPDMLFVRLLDDPRTGLRTYTDNTADNVISDYFSGQGELLFTWSDPAGGVPSTFDLVYSFTDANLATLTSYLLDPHSSTRSDFGLGFDPDCHYYNSGIQFQITTEVRPPSRVPDSSATMVLFGSSLLGLAFARRRFAHRH